MWKVTSNLHWFDTIRCSARIGSTWFAVKLHCVREGWTRFPHMIVPHQFLVSAPVPARLQAEHIRFGYVNSPERRQLYDKLASVI